MSVEPQKWIWEGDQTQRRYQIRLAGSNEHIATVNNLPPERLATKSPAQAKDRAITISLAPEMLYQLERLNQFLLELNMSNSIVSETLRRRARSLQETAGDLVFRASSKVVEDASQSIQASASEFGLGERWSWDRHALPGNPVAFLDRDLSGGKKASLFKVQALGVGTLFEARNAQGKSIGVVPQVGQAAKLAEAYVFFQEMRQRFGGEETELLAEMISACGQKINVKEFAAPFHGVLFLKHVGKTEREIEAALANRVDLEPVGAARRP